MLTGRRFGDTDVTSCPCKTMRPSSGTSKPAIIRRVVVLPQPLGPSSEKNSPSAMSSVTSCTASTLPNRLLTLSRAMATLGPSCIRVECKPGGHRFGLLPIERGHRVIPSAACYEDPCSEALEAWQSVGAALDHLDLVDHSFGVAVRGRLVEVGEQLFAPAAEAVREGGEGGDRRPLDRRLEGTQPPLGLLPVAGAVDGAEALLQPPGLGQHGLGLEELAECAPLALAEPLGPFQQPPPRAPQLGAEATAALLAADRTRAAAEALALTADGVERAVGAADEVEGVEHDRHARQRRPQRLPVGEGGIDRDRLQRPPLLLGQRAQEALERAPVAALEHLDDAAAIGVTDDRHQPLRAAPVRGLVDRKPARERPRAGSELPGGAEPEGALDLVAARLLLARDLELGAARAQPREEVGAEARADPLPGGQAGMRLAEAVPAAAAAKAPLAPDERYPPARKRQVAHPHPRSLLHLQVRPATQAAAARHHG